MLLLIKHGFQIHLFSGYKNVFKGIIKIDMFQFHGKGEKLSTKLLDNEGARLQSIVINVF